jgi:dihydrofolate reductase
LETAWTVIGNGPANPFTLRGWSTAANDKEDRVGRIVVTEFVSLDGVMEDPGGSESFKHGGWSFEIERGDEGDKFKLDETLSSEALLLGRATYEGFAAAWPSREGEFADKFNTMPKYVVSSTLEEPEWNNSTVLRGDVAGEVAKLRQEHEGDIVVHGSARLVQTLVEHDLVDELRLMVFPVVLGTGKRVFGETSDKKRLRLVDSKVVGDGVAILVYEPAGDQARGSDSD